MAISDLIGKGTLSTNVLKKDSMESRAEIISDGCTKAIESIDEQKITKALLKKNKNSWVKINGDGYKLTLRYKNKIIKIDAEHDAIDFNELQDVRECLENIKKELKKEDYGSMVWCLRNINSKHWRKASKPVKPTLVKPTPIKPPESSS